MKTEDLDHIVDKALRKEPNFRLSDDFALKMTDVVIRREQWKTDFREYLLLSAVVIGLGLVVSGIFYFIDKEAILRFVNFLSNNMLLVIGGALILNFVLFADRVLLRLLFNRWSRT